MRAYDPTLGRFISRDPLGRAPLVFADNPYVYAGNNPLTNVDPSGQYRAAGHGATTRAEPQHLVRPSQGRCCIIWGECRRTSHMLRSVAAYWRAHAT